MDLTSKTIGRTTKRLKNDLQGPGEMAQGLKALTARAESATLVASTHVRQFKTTCNSSSKRPNTLFWPPEVPALICTNTHTLTDSAVGLLTEEKPKRLLSQVRKLRRKPAILKVHHPLPSHGPSPRVYLSGNLSKF